MAPMTKGKSVPLTARLARRRVWVQAALLAVWLDPLAIRLHTLCGPVFHCHSCPLATLACPIGVLANFAAIHVIPFIALGTLAATGAIFGAFICGWVCPFGLVQDLIGRVPLRKYELPGWMGHCRYAVLVVLVLAIPYWFGEGNALFFCRLCPAGAMEAAIPFTAGQAMAGKETLWPSAAKTIIFLLILAAMLFTWRPWCALLCPLGGIYGLFNRFSLFFLRFNPQECNDCDACRSLCRRRGPSERRSGDLRCIRCLDCTRCSAVTLASVFGPK
jgi:polyferredoxin